MTAPGAPPWGPDDPLHGLPVGMDMGMDPLDPEALAQWLGCAPADPLPLSLPATSGGPLEITSSGGGSGSTGTTFTKSLSKQEERQERARAQNRAKQQRFRQRQKERKEQLAADFETTAADLEREQLLNDSLKTSCATLEAVKAQKDTAVKVLEAAASGDQATAQPQALEQGDGGGSAATAVPSSALAQQLWSLSFRERVQLTTRMFCETEPAHQALKDHVGADACTPPDGFAIALNVRQKLAGTFVEHRPQMLQAALTITADIMLQDWADFGELAAEAVRDFEEGTLTEEGVAERMAGATMYFAILGTMLLKHKPEVMQRLLAHALLPGETEEAAAARWRQVGLGMGVTKEEAARLVPAYQTYCDRMQQLRADTATAMQTLQEVQESLGAQMLEAGLSTTVQQYLKLFEAAGQLSHQPDAALLITMEFVSGAGAWATPLQKARMLALCRPLHPDTVSVVREGLLHYGLMPDSCTGARQPPSLSALCSAAPQ